jgi:hypothetical protein
MIYCKDCAQEYGPPFIWMTNGMWETLGYEPQDFACSVCIMKRVNLLSDKYGAWVWHLTQGHGNHKLERCKTEIEVKYI